MFEGVISVVGHDQQKFPIISELVLTLTNIALQLRNKESVIKITTKPGQLSTTQTVLKICQRLPNKAIGNKPTRFPTSS